MPARIPTFGLVALLAAVPAAPTRRSSATPTWAGWRTASTATRRSRGVPATTSTWRGPGDCGSRGPWGTSVSANITPDPETGIGAWTDQQVRDALAKGVRPDGSRLAVPMPAYYFRNMTDDDLHGRRRLAADAPADPQRGPVARRTRPRARRADPRWPRPLGRRGPRPLPGGAEEEATGELERRGGRERRASVRRGAGSPRGREPSPRPVIL